MVCNDYWSSPYEYDNTYDPWKQNPWQQNPYPWVAPPSSPIFPQPYVPDLEDIGDWTIHFPTVWDDSMCEDKRHRLYRAIGLPCPCKDKFEKELPQKISDHLKGAMERSAERRAKKQKWVPDSNPYSPPWQPQPGPYWGQQWSDNTTSINRYQTWTSGNTSSISLV